VALKFFSLILCGTLLLEAQTLSELVELAQKNRTVEAANLTLQAKEKAYESTKSGYLPSLNLTGSYLSTYNETPASARDTLRGGANLHFTLYDGGKREALYDKLLYSVDASKSSLESLKNIITLDVARLYFEYLSYEAHKKSVEQEIEQLKEELKRVEMFYTTGSVTRDEVDKLDSRLKSQEVALSEIALQSQRALHTLEYYTSQEHSIITSGSSIKLVEQQKTQVRHDIMALGHEAKALMSDAQTIKSANLPSVNFDNAYTYSEYFFADKALDRGFLVNTQNVALVNVTWNVLDFGAISEAYESKQYEYLSKKSALEFELEKANIEQRLAQKELEILEMKLTATKASFDAAAATYELIKMKYQNGTIDNVAYLESLSEKFSAYYAHEKVKNDIEIKKAELLYYSGEIIKEFL